MKLAELSSILYSTRGYTQLAIIYDEKTASDLVTGTVDILIKEYGDKEVKQIQAFENQLIITI